MSFRVRPATKPNLTWRLLMKKAKLVFTLIFCVFFFSTFVSAGEYPDKDIKHIMPWGAGGGTDTVMRGFMKIWKTI